MPTSAELPAFPLISTQMPPLEWLRFAVLRDAPWLPGGRYVGMETAAITPWPHQAVVARQVIRSWPASFLLCDEVGLGKTIEAGLIIRSLFLSGCACRVLVAVPASLAGQWQREMQAVHCVKAMEKAEQELGEAQHLLNLLSAWALMTERRRIGKGAEGFWDEMNAILAAYNGKERLCIGGIPIEFREPLRMLPHCAQFPRNGASGSVVMTPELLRTSTGAAMRVANGMRVRHERLLPKTIMTRLLRMAGELV